MVGNWVCLAAGDDACGVDVHEGEGAAVDADGEGAVVGELGFDLGDGEIFVVLDAFYF